MGTIIVGGILLLAVAGIIGGMLRDKKNGKTSCGGDCGHCRGCH
ncbi:MAG: FeoB-associated Cys-rich membrane protein [bacterium]|nr:FeoB-associated Cys-rich membrane protein [bacterium]